MVTEIKLLERNLDDARRNFNVAISRMTTAKIVADVAILRLREAERDLESIKISSARLGGENG